MKKTLMTLLVSLMLIGNVYGSTITLNINDKVVEAPVAPIQEAGVTLVPLRIISQNLGAQVNWDGPSKTITINDKTTQIKLVINKNTVTVNGQKQELLLAPKLKDQTTMVPLRFIGEKLGAHVDWNSKTKTVIVKSKADKNKINYQGDLVLVEGVEVPHGQGKFLLEGAVLEGRFDKGNPIGKMKIILPDKTTGEAELVGDLTKGVIKVKLANGISGELKVKDSMPDGKFKMNLPGGGFIELDVLKLF